MAHLGQVCSSECTSLMLVDPDEWTVSEPRLVDDDERDSAPLGGCEMVVVRAERVDDEPIDGGVANWREPG